VTEWQRTRPVALQQHLEGHQVQEQRVMLGQKEVLSLE
jgi:hypothetical protein